MHKSDSRGYILLEILIGVAILTILFAGITSNVILDQKVSTERAGIASLQQLTTGLYQFSQSFGAMPDTLSRLSTGVIGTPVNCSSVSVLPGSLTNAAPSGYAVNYLPQNRITNYSCPNGMSGYSGYSIALTPANGNTLLAQRSYFSCTGYGGCDGLIHFRDDGQVPTLADPVASAPNSLGIVGGGSGGTGNGGTSSPAVTIWNPLSGNYALGSQVLRAAHINFDTCTGAGDSGFVGTFVAIRNNVSTDPCQSPADWFCTCQPSYSPAPPPFLNGQFSALLNGNSANNITLSNSLSSVGTYQTLSISLSVPLGTQFGLVTALRDLTTNQYLLCDVMGDPYYNPPANNISCSVTIGSGPNLGIPDSGSHIPISGWSGSNFVVSPGDQIIADIFVIGAGQCPVNLSWQLQ